MAEISITILPLAANGTVFKGETYKQDGQVSERIDRLEKKNDVTSARLDLLRRCSNPVLAPVKLEPARAK